MVLSLTLTSISSFFRPGNSAFTTTSSPSVNRSIDGEISSNSDVLNRGHHDGPKNGLLKKSSNHVSISWKGERALEGSAFAKAFDSFDFSFVMSQTPVVKNLNCF